MKDFISKNLYKILLGLLVVIFTVISAFGVGNMKAPGTYYTFGEIDTDYKYNSVAYKLNLDDGNGGKYDIASIWVNVGSYHVTPSGEDLSIQAGLSSYDNVAFTNVGEIKVKNGYNTTDIGGWQAICYGTLVEAKKNSEYLVINIKNESIVKINEIAVVAKDANGNIVLVSAEALGAGAKKNITDSIRESGEFDTSDAAKARASKLIDEGYKFDLASLTGTTAYKDDQKSLFLSSEVEILDSVRNITSGKGYFVSATAHPLAYYFMALGTLIFGNTTLGLRFIPALFAIASIIMMFLLGKVLFGKEGLGLLTAFIYAIGGFALSSATIGNPASIFVFFIIIAFFTAVKFYKKGISNITPKKSYLNLLCSGLAFALAVTIKTQAMYFLPALLLVLVFGFVRQFKAYKLKADRIGDKEEAQKNNKAIYKNKLITCLSITAISYILVPIMLYIITYLAGYATYSVFYGNNNVFAYALTNFTASFTAQLNSIYASANAVGGVGGWALNYVGETLGANKQAFGNMILTFIGVFGIVYMIFYSSIALSDGIKTKEGIPLEKKSGVLIPYLFCMVAFLGGWLLQFIGAEAGISGYLAPSVFLAPIIVAFVNTFETEEQKTLFNIGNFQVTISRIVVCVVLLAATVAFALSVGAYLGVATNEKIFSWNMLHK